MSFMQPQVTDKQRWYQVDTQNEGLVSYPASLFTESWVREAHGCEAVDPNDEIDPVTIIEGFGARMSAPGYLDCTEWTVFDTAEQAEAYLAEEYGDEDADEAEEM